MQQQDLFVSIAMPKSKTEREATNSIGVFRGHYERGKKEAETQKMHLPFCFLLQKKLVDCEKATALRSLLSLFPTAEWSRITWDKELLSLSLSRRFSRDKRDDKKMELEPVAVFFFKMPDTNFLPLSCFVYAHVYFKSSEKFFYTFFFSLERRDYCSRGSSWLRYELAYLFSPRPPYKEKV